MPKSFGLLRKKQKNENKTADGRNTDFFITIIELLPDLSGIIISSLKSIGQF